MFYIQSFFTIKKEPVSSPYPSAGSLITKLTSPGSPVTVASHSPASIPVKLNEILFSVSPPTISALVSLEYFIPEGEVMTTEFGTSVLVHDTVTDAFPSIPSVSRTALAVLSVFTSLPSSSSIFIS